MRTKFAALLVLPVAIALTGCASTPRQESAGQFVDSSVITAKVKAKLVADKSVSSLPISVETYKRTVLLSGFVNTPYQKLRAERDAASVEGVVLVKNRLVVKRR